MEDYGSETCAKASGPMIPGIWLAYPSHDRRHCILAMPPASIEILLESGDIWYTVCQRRGRFTGAARSCAMSKGTANLRLHEAG